MNKDFGKLILNELHDFKVDNESTSYEMQWIIDRLADNSLKKLAPKISIIGLHILTELLEEDLAGTTLANRLKVTRSGITRAAAKLQSLSLIRSYQLEDDKKKVYYHILPQAKEIAKIHKQMHENLEEGFIKQIENDYSVDELTLILNFLQTVNQINKKF